MGIHSPCDSGTVGKLHKGVGSGIDIIILCHTDEFCIFCNGSDSDVQASQEIKRVNYKISNVRFI